MALINTLDAPGEFDAAAKLREGEPYFMLIGRDRLAPPLVLEWAKQSRMRALRMGDWAGQPELPEAERADELEKATEAEQIAWSMQAYKAGRDKPVKWPRTESYSGIELPEDQQRRDRIQRARTKAAEQLNNAIGEIAGLVNVLQADAKPGETVLGGAALDHMLSVAVDAIPHLRELADTFVPPRRVLNR